jgi:hypothetical protein
MCRRYRAQEPKPLPNEQYPNMWLARAVPSRYRHIGPFKVFPSHCETFLRERRKKAILGVTSAVRA